MLAWRTAFGRYFILSHNSVDQFRSFSSNAIAVFYVKTVFRDELLDENASTDLSPAIAVCCIVG